MGEPTLQAHSERPGLHGSMLTGAIASPGPEIAPPTHPSGNFNRGLLPN
jgi:hypothetical protein